MLHSSDPIVVGSQRELFIDGHLIDTQLGTELRLQTPEPCEVALEFEGSTSIFCTVLKVEGGYRLYYRGKQGGTRDEIGETTRIAESPDGICWRRPEVGEGEYAGTNVLFGGMSHNFSPVVDERPDCPPEQRYKALVGKISTGVMAMASPDGLRWQKMQEAPVLTRESAPYVKMFDSQNVAFWSQREGCYVAFFRVWHEGLRRVARAQSMDFLRWEKIQLMEYRGADGGPGALEELYVNQTFPYPRAPHLYISLAARFITGRIIMTEAQAEELQLLRTMSWDVSDAVLLTSREGAIYDRTFPEALVRPGPGLGNWGSRSNFPALNVVQTGESEMSFYVCRNYAQPGAHLRRYRMRLDGFGALHAPWAGGEMITRPLLMEGSRLSLNYATSAAGSIRLEIQDAHGRPLPGFKLDESLPLIGDEVDGTPKWLWRKDFSLLSGQPIRLRFVMKDADLYALQMVSET